MSRAFNFSAGPAMLPEAVLQQAQSEMLDWQGTGMSVMEMSHRGKEFMSIYEKAVQDLRDLYALPDDYHVLFLQGGASSQFAMVPMNLMPGKSHAAYVHSGAWAKKAIAEAKRYAEVRVLASAEDNGFTAMPALDSTQLHADTAYLHITSNETIGGVQYQQFPDSGEVPLVVDMSSDILSRQLDLSRFGLIYAGAQKNIGPAGLTVVMVRDDLLREPLAGTPSLFDYRAQVKNDSMVNTPPTYSIYFAGLVFAWLKEQGGLAAMEAINEDKAQRLYAAIDGSDFYSSPVDPAFRSRMNVPFTLADAALDGLFVQQSAAAGLLTLKGHRSVGGMRASIYNAMPQAGIDALITFMGAFEKDHG